MYVLYKKHNKKNSGTAVLPASSGTRCIFQCHRDHENGNLFFFLLSFCLLTRFRKHFTSKYFSGFPDEARKPVTVSMARILENDVYKIAWNPFRGTPKHIRAYFLIKHALPNYASPRIAKKFHTTKRCPRTYFNVTQAMHQSPEFTDAVLQTLRSKNAAWL